MGLLDQVTGGLGELMGGGNGAVATPISSGQSSGSFLGDHTKLISAAMGTLLGYKAGGLGGGIAGGAAGSAIGSLINQFKSHNVPQVDSWVKPGANEPVTPQQVEQAVGTDKVAEIAQQAGVSHQEAASGLAAWLPKIVDKLTPGGQIPDNMTLQQAMSQVK